MIDFDDVFGTIARLPDDAVEQFLFDCVEHRFGRDHLASDYRFTLELPSGYRVLMPTVWIEGQITNGGASQYFWNRLHDCHLMTGDAIDAYDIIKAIAQAAALRECVRVFMSLEAECRWLKENKTEYDGFGDWVKKWDSLNFSGDGPLCGWDEEISKNFRVPWIRRNVDLFSFDPQATP